MQNNNIVDRLAGSHGQLISRNFEFFNCFDSAQEAGEEFRIFPPNSEDADWRIQVFRDTDSTTAPIRQITVNESISNEDLEKINRIIACIERGFGVGFDAISHVRS